MSQEPAEAPEVSENDVVEAQMAEQAAMNEQQSQYLLRRVVSLRVALNRAEKRIAELEAVTEDDVSGLEDVNE